MPESKKSQRWVAGDRRFAENHFQTTTATFYATVKIARTFEFVEH